MEAAKDTIPRNFDNWFRGSSGKTRSERRDVVRRFRAWSNSLGLHAQEHLFMIGQAALSEAESKNGGPFQEVNLPPNGPKAQVNAREILPDAVYSCDDVAAMFGVTRATVINWERAGKIRGKKMSRSKAPVFLGSDILAYLRG